MSGQESFDRTFKFVPRNRMYARLFIFFYVANRLISRLGYDRVCFDLLVYLASFFKWCL